MGAPSASSRTSAADVSRPDKSQFAEPSLVPMTMQVFEVLARGFANMAASASGQKNIRN